MNVKSHIHTVFFGTHDFAATILEGLLSSPLFSVDLVITRPDEPVGRSQELQSPPVKLLVESKGIKVEQPENLKNYRIEKLKNYELGVTAQYGGLIPKSILDSFQRGMINVHTSLLPKYRGASPIQHAIMNGDTETGVTVMLMDVGLDTGPILLQKKVSIEPDDTYEILDKKLSIVGLKALLEAVPQYIAGDLKPTPQDESHATICKKLSRDDGHVDWNKSVEEIYNRYRGLHPWPGIWTMVDGKRLKLLNVKPTEKAIPTGTVVFEQDHLFIGCSTGSLEILELQPEGKKVMDANAFKAGYKTLNGTTVS